MREDRITLVGFSAPKFLEAHIHLPCFTFMHNPCIYESAAYPVSHHTTKAGAYRAMRIKLLADYEEHCRIHGGHGDLGIKKDRGLKWCRSHVGYWIEKQVLVVEQNTDAVGSLL